MPMSYGAPTAPSYPASYSLPAPQPLVGVPTSYPMIPAPGINATELPFPEAAATGIPNNTRSVGLPK